MRFLSPWFRLRRRPSRSEVDVSPETAEILASLEQGQQSTVLPPDVMALAMERVLLGVTRDEFPDI